jgi:outer membrane protein assembly factor BamB
MFEDQQMGWTESYSGTSSRRLVVMDRHDGQVLWQREAQIGFRHNAIVSTGDTLFLIDGLSENAVKFLSRRGQDAEQPSVVLALDLRTGEERWRTDSNVFGTFLLYSEEHDILVEGGSQDLRRRLATSRGMSPRGEAAMAKSSGKSAVLLPAAIRGDMLIPDGPATPSRC